MRWYLVLISLGLCSQVYAEDQLPDVQINGKFYSYSQAVQERGGLFTSTPQGDHVVSIGEKKYQVRNIEGRRAVNASLFPNSVLVGFKFTNSLGSSKVFINNRGPVSSLEIDRNGNGGGNVYIEASSVEQKIELRRNKKSINDRFKLGNRQSVECKGKKKLSCEAS